MTTFLLHGGATSKELPGNDDFFSRFLTLVDKPEVTVLLCYWSRSRDEWPKKSEQDRRRISKDTSKKVTFLVAEDAEDLFEKLKTSDVLYVAGGEAELLEPCYPLLKHLRAALEGKVYAGSSMGAFLAAEQYVLSPDAKDDEEVHAGVGLISIQVLCHWDREDTKDLKLGLLDPKKKIFTLNEGEFVELRD